MRVDGARKKCGGLQYSSPGTANKNAADRPTFPGCDWVGPGCNPAAGVVFVTQRKGIVVDKRFPEYTDSSAGPACGYRGTQRAQEASKQAGKA